MLRPDSPAKGVGLVLVKRSDRTTMVHIAACHMAQRGGAVAWPWAATAPLEVVRAAAVRADYRLCRTCRPIPDGQPVGRSRRPTR